jgi:hypothetical protein
MRHTFRNTVLKTVAALALMAMTALGALASDDPPGPGTTPLPRPDLTIQEVKPVYMYFGRSGVRIKDKLWVKIANVGQAHTGNFMMLFQWAQGYSDEQMYYLFQFSLAPGETMWKMVSSNGYDLYAPGHHSQLIMDYFQNINESKENNNVYNFP